MYSTLTINSLPTLLTSIVNFAVANGWIVNTDQVEGLGRRVTLSKIAGMYVHLRSFSFEAGACTGIQTGLNHGIAVVVSRTNNTTSINNNTEYSFVTGMLPINHLAPFTYHLFSTQDGNNIHVAVVTSAVNNTAQEASVFCGFGTSINKTTTVNEGWYVYSHGANYSGSNILDMNLSYSILLGNRQSFLLGSSTTAYNSPQFSFYSTTPYYGGSSNLYYNNSTNGTLGGILPHSGTRNAGVGVYDTLRSNSASTAFANTTIIPSNIFMKHVSSGYNLIGTVPLLWSHNAVPTLYKNGQIVPMNGKNYALFQYHAYEVIS